jgi:hypothetical protein
VRLSRGANGLVEIEWQSALRPVPLVNRQLIVRTNRGVLDGAIAAI